MAEPTTRTEFKAWCKRKLGYPVIDINVDDDQVDDRVDEAIQYWNTFMQNGMQRMYLKYKLTADDVNRSKTNVVETVTAQGSGASEVATSTIAVAVSATDTTVTLADATSFPITGSIDVTSTTISNTLNGAVSAGDTSVTLTAGGAFPSSGKITIATDGTNVGETVSYSSKAGHVLTTSALKYPHKTGATVTFVENVTVSAKTGNVLTTTAFANAFDVGATVTLYISATWEIGQDYIPMPDGILSVMRILPFTDRGNLNMFDIRYQLRLNDLYDFSDISVIHYQMVMWQLDLLDMLLVGEKPINFNQIGDRLYIDMAWASDMDVGEYLVMECYRKINAAEYQKAYNDFWLKRYATALIKRQWGENLIKFQGVTMLGGVSMNGETIYNEAIREIGELETEGRLTFEEPLMFDIG